MAKQISAGLRAHLDQEVTALCTCWEITRVDGKVIRLTDNDEDVNVGGLSYSAVGGYQRSAIESSATLSVDNLDVVGISSDLVLPESEMRLGLFDNAQVKVFVTPWIGAVGGEIKMRRGFFGEVQVLPNGTYKVELRGLMQRLSHTYTDVFSPTCLHDLGDKACRIVIEPSFRRASKAYAVGTTVRASALTNAGTVRKYTIPDASFEITGAANGFAGSQYWLDTGATPMGVLTVGAKVGQYAAGGITGTAAAIQQDVDIISATGLTAAEIDQSTPVSNMYWWRRDENGDRGRVRQQFLDCDFSELGLGQSYNTTVGQAGLNLDFSAIPNFTVEAWVRLADSSGDLMLFGDSVVENEGYFLGWRNDRFIRFFINPAGNTGGADVASSSTTIPLNTWTHIAFVREGTTYTTYINGVQVGTGTSSNGAAMRFDSFFTDGVSANAQIAEFRVWNVARVASEINLAKDQTLNTPTTGLIHYWRMAGNGNDSGSTGGITLAGGTFVSTNLPPIAVKTAHQVTAVSQDTGFTSVGTTWVSQNFLNVRIPPGTRYTRLIFDIDNGGSGFTSSAYLDGLYGWTYSPDNATIYSGDLGNVYMECTTAGTSSASAFPGFGGGTPVVGQSYTDGTVTWTARNAFLRAGVVTEASDARTFRATVSDSRAVDAWFNGGVVTFETGANAGVSMEVKEWTQAGGITELFLSLPNNIQPGDFFRVYPGCDKSRISCAAIFRNIVNFSGFPDVPGQDALIRSPDAS